MDFSNFMYYIKSGINDARHNSAMSISSVIIVIAGMCVLGVYSLISMNVNYLSRQICEKYTITAYIEKGTPEDRAEEIRTEICGIDGVKNVVFVSETEALEDCKETFGESSDFLNGLEDDNPLRGSMIITMDNITSSAAIAESVEKVIDVVWVKDDSELADRITASSVMVERISLILLVVFLAIAVFIISSTVRITILARRNDIHTMRYLGATNRFIAVPFAVEGIIIGIVGAVVAYLLTMVCYNFLSVRILSFMKGMLHIYHTSSVAFRLLAEYLLSGFIIGGLSSVFPLVKYMKV